MVFSPKVNCNRMGGYLPEDVPSIGRLAGAAGTGADPSPTMTTIPFIVFIGAPLNAEIAPASIKLARAPTNAFFTVQNLLRRI